MREDLWEAQQRILAWGWPGAGRTSSQHLLHWSSWWTVWRTHWNWIWAILHIWQFCDHPSCIKVVTKITCDKDHLWQKSMFLNMKNQCVQNVEWWQNFVSSLSEKNIGGTDWILPNITGCGIGYRAGYRVLHMGSCLSCLSDASLGGSVPLRTKTMGYGLGIAKYYRVSGIGYLSHMGLCLSCLSGRECASQYYTHPAPQPKSLETSTTPGSPWTGRPKLRPAGQPILTSITGEPRFELDLITFVITTPG